MKMKTALVAIVAVLVTLAAARSDAVIYENKMIGTIQPFIAGDNCFYFTLQGVTEADPVKPGSPWFAISRSDTGAKDAMATLLSAKYQGIAIRVFSNGTLTCGYASASVVQLY
jgi:hypothetical protein